MKILIKRNALSLFVESMQGKEVNPESAPNTEYLHIIEEVQGRTIELAEEGHAEVPNTFMFKPIEGLINDPFSLPRNLCWPTMGHKEILRICNKCGKIKMKGDEIPCGLEENKEPVNCAKYVINY